MYELLQFAAISACSVLQQHRALIASLGHNVNVAVCVRVCSFVFPFWCNFSVVLALDVVAVNVVGYHHF